MFENLDEYQFEPRSSVDVLSRFSCEKHIKDYEVSVLELILECNAY